MLRKSKHLAQGHKAKKSWTMILTQVCLSSEAQFLTTGLYFICSSKYIFPRLSMPTDLLYSQKMSGNTETGT